VSEQLVLPLGHRAALGREDFLVGEGNKDAVAWIDAWPAWRAAGLVVFGPHGSGKTHLAEVWRARCAAPIIQSIDIAGDPQTILGGARQIVIEHDDAPIDQVAVLHLHNTLAAQGGHTLWLARRPVREWSIGLADLRSRLMALPAVTMSAPDDALMAAVLIKLFSDRQLDVEPALIDFLIRRIERSLAVAARTVELLDQAAMSQGRRITVPLARALLGSV
jgi:chromosomal replication initiation ATPase DnaA